MNQQTMLIVGALILAYFIFGRKASAGTGTPPPGTKDTGGAVSTTAGASTGAGTTDNSVWTGIGAFLGGIASGFKDGGTPQQ